MPTAFRADIVNADKQMVDRYTEWRIDPNGYEYRYNLTRLTTEHKPRIPKPSPVPLKPFVVTVRGEVWHIQSKDAESACRPFQLNKNDKIEVREE